MIEDLVHSIGDLGPWAYLALFLITATEAAAFVGLFVPGETTLLLAGYLASQGEIDLGTVLVVAIVGGIVGDSLGYEIGRHLGPRLRSGRLGALVGDHRWERAHEIVARHGARAVVAGRVIGMLRAVVPAVVGDARMPYRRFFLWNVVGAVVWTPVVIMAGYIAGDAYESVASAFGRATAVVVVAAGAAALIWHRRHRNGGLPEPVAQALD